MKWLLGMSCARLRFGLHDPCGFLLTRDILWFCDSLFCLFFRFSPAACRYTRHKLQSVKEMRFTPKSCSPRSRNPALDLIMWLSLLKAKEWPFLSRKRWHTSVNPFQIVIRGLSVNLPNSSSWGNLLWPAHCPVNQVQGCTRKDPMVLDEEKTDHLGQNSAWIVVLKLIKVSGSPWV